MDFIDWLNNVYYEGADFIDEDDFQQFLEEEGLDTDIAALKADYDRYAKLNGDRAETDALADDDTAVDIVEEDEGDDYITLDDNDGKLSDERCKDVIDDMSNDELAPVYKWARENYEPAKGLSDQEIGMKFALDEAWATDLATAYYEANPDLLDKDDESDDAEPEVSETTIISESDNDGDGEVDEVSIDVSGDGKADDAISSDEIDVSPVEDSTIKNILDALADHRY